MTQPPDPFEFLKHLWGPMGVPLSGLMVPTIDQNELDRRIAELKSVENWLNMNLNVLRMTVHGLEMQKAGLAAIQSGAGKMESGSARAPGGDQGKSTGSSESTGPDPKSRR